MTYKILAINPGSTSTKIGVYENESECVSLSVEHDADTLRKFPGICDQYEYRKTCILEALCGHGISPADMDAFVGRGGGLVSCPGGTYEINDILYEHARTCHTVKHPAALGPVLARNFADQYHARAFVVNPPDVDEMQDVARITGLHRVYRQSRFHALNQKQVAILAASDLGKDYQECNFVVAHIGGGISVTAHCRGRCIDTTDIVGGDGPFAPTRMGQIPAEDLIKLCFDSAGSEKQMLELLTKSGGLVNHFHTSDLRQIAAKAREGCRHALLVYQALGYQIAKAIGAYSTVLCGAVDAILLTGGIARDQELLSQISRMCGYIAPIRVYPGEHELEALAYGALRVLTGKEKSLTYTGIPVFDMLPIW